MEVYFPNKNCFCLLISHLFSKFRKWISFYVVKIINENQLTQMQRQPEHKLQQWHLKYSTSLGSTNQDVKSPLDRQPIELKDKKKKKIFTILYYLLCAFSSK